MISVIGLGYVGLPLLHELSMVYAKSIGFDIDENKIQDILISNSEISGLDKAKRDECILNGVIFTSTPDRLLDSNVKIICVPTPLDSRGIPDYRHLVEALDLVGKPRSVNGLFFVKMRGSN